MRFILLIGVLILAACSSNDENVQIQQDADTLYNDAASALDDENYVEATRLFEEVERQHPYSKWATQSQLMAAYASYKDQRYDDAVLALDRFIELHPGSDDLDYAFYLKALSFYEQISDVRRDQEMTRKSLSSLNSLIRRFPDSRYTRDAILKRDLTVDHLAGKEMEIGRYYLKKGEVNAAINRFLSVVREYQTTTHAAEALYRLSESYLLIGLREQSTRVAAVLGYNYPGSKWYERAYALLDDAQRAKLGAEQGWLKRTMDRLLNPLGDDSDEDAGAAFESQTPDTEGSADEEAKRNWLDAILDTLPGGDETE